jgi:hypothetical protein
MIATLTYSPAALAARRVSLRRFCGVVGIVAGVLAILIGVWQPANFFRAYLFAALAGLNPVAGCLLLTFIHRMTGGSWGQTLAPALDAGVRMVPWALLFCVPLLFGLRDLYPWAAPDLLAPPARALLAKHPLYFARGAFFLRAGCYALSFLVLLGLARRGRGIPWTGPVGMILYVITVYLLSVDYVLSLEPGWVSTGFPLVFMAGEGLSALAFCVAVTIFGGAPEGVEPGSPGDWKKIGNLLLGMLMFWAYTAYAQFLITWAGNAPGPAAWYIHRNAGGWHYLLIALAIFHLLVPVVLLLSNRTKRRTRFFGGLALGVLLCQTIYLYTLILPSFRTAGIDFHGLDALLPLALDGVWLWCFFGLAATVREGLAYD